jgi:micrococcal nuclease
MNKKAQIYLIAIMSILILALILIIYFYYPTIKNYLKDTKTSAENKVAEECISDNCAVDVLDGDTFRLKNGEHVRLICINTPERTDEGYFEAKDFLTELIEGKEVRLEKDVSERDKYNRLLRYVYINVTNSSGFSREIFVNRELVQQGFAVVWRYPPDVSRCGEIGGA